MCQGPSGGPESRATNSCQFAQDIPDFSTVSPRAQKTPQCHADWDAWSPRGGVTSWEHPLQKLFQPNPYLKLYVWRTQPKTQGRRANEYWGGGGQAVGEVGLSHPSKLPLIFWESSWNLRGCPHPEVPLTCAKPGLESEHALELRSWSHGVPPQTLRSSQLLCHHGLPLYPSICPLPNRTQPWS